MAVRLGQRFLQAKTFVVIAAWVMLASAHAAAQLVQRQMLGDMAVALSVTPLLAPDAEAGSVEAPHRLTVWLRERESGRGIDDARVMVDVAEQGFAGTQGALVAAADEAGRYEAIQSMPGRVPYRILVHVRRVGEARSLEAMFQYRHHH